MTGSCGASRIASRVVEITWSSAARRDRYATGLPLPAPVVSTRARNAVACWYSNSERCCAACASSTEPKTDESELLRAADCAALAIAPSGARLSGSARAPAETRPIIAPPATSSSPAAIWSIRRDERRAGAMTGSLGWSSAAGTESSAAMASHRVRGRPNGSRSAWAIASNDVYAARSCAHTSQEARCVASSRVAVPSASSARRSVCRCSMFRSVGAR